MKKSALAVIVLFIFFSSCEIEYRDGHRYPHAMGWEHRHHPDHHELYNHGWHHDKNGNEIIGSPPAKDFNHSKEGGI